VTGGFQAVRRLVTGVLITLLLAAPAAVSQVPEPTGLLVDEAGALDEAERSALAARLKAIQDSGRAQVAILVASGTGGEGLADYALKVAEKWQLGRAGRDDGLLILVIPSASAARIEVGYGLEGAIPDARASQWLDDLLPAMKRKELAAGLAQLLDRVEAVLPEKVDAGEGRELFADHPEWKAPFLLLIFSPFALFPLFFGRWGCVASGPLFAAMAGGAAWALWDSQAAGMAAAAIALPFPFLWALNWSDDGELKSWLRRAKALGNAVALFLFFSIITVFVGAGMSVMEPSIIWVAPVVGGLFAMMLSMFLFPGTTHYLAVVLRSVIHFLFTLAVAWAALPPFVPGQGTIALAVATLVTASAALGLWLESRHSMRWARWCFGFALFVTVPFALLALVMSAVGDELEVQIAQAAAGGGSLAGALAFAAKHGLLAAVKIGLGGRFGGGGAGRG
jgi:uncharacterized protein